MSKPLVQDTKTVNYQNHKPSGYRLNVVNRITNTSKQYIYRSYTCMDKFYEQIKTIEKESMTELKRNKPIMITDEEEQQFIDATTCYICGDCFTGND